ncbi:hexaprenyldihydroxybenzoate methyltransferase [Plectosphaerella cucumerina]|uniref:Ubiquinone biosynthesis O-methyltransferase, mitochondrial n=1 Tax=Plectosphaerella cucumerina TaxID=40658 RepID=A0A8K0THG7_9PEZI|nr:hexaprenyldihydroxybenzoate methyltransferase [Plectosphaerella cucumerina]
MAATPSRPAAAALLRQLRRVTPRPPSALASRLNTPRQSPASAARPSSTFTSVDPREVSHFTALAETWWDPHGSSRLLHLMNPVRHDFVRRCRASVPPAEQTTTPGTAPEGLRYLDIGCGGGIFAESAARLPTTASVTAIDPTPSVLAVARAHARRDPSLRPPRLNYLSATIESLPLPRTRADQFDVVSVFEVVEHVESPAEFLARAAPFVRPGGWLVGSTIARTFVSWVTTNLVAEDILGIVPKGTHDWNKYINEDELRSWVLARGGWSDARVSGVMYVPGMGWKEVAGSEKVGNYFFAFRRSLDADDLVRDPEVVPMKEGGVQGSA